MNQLISEYVQAGFYTAVASPNFRASFAEFLSRPTPKGMDGEFIEALIYMLGATIDAAKAKGFKVDGDPVLARTAIEHRVAAISDWASAPQLYVLLSAAVAKLIEAGAVITPPAQPEPPKQTINLTPHFDIRVEQEPTEVVITLPDQLDVNIAGMPDRVTTSTVERDSAGNIVRTTQTEMDA